MRNYGTGGAVRIATLWGGALIARRTRCRMKREATVNSPDDRIWDLRQGDPDDDRASPYGRGWRALLVSTVLEFNFLTATIAFVILVIVPVMLVGLTPPLMRSS